MSDNMIHEIPLDEIYEDKEFNCRGYIAYNEVVDLARSIQADGLISPITVTPLTAKERETHPGIPPTAKYKILCGHRRYLAHKVIEGATTIRAMIDEDTARKNHSFINLVENIQRKDLDMVQESIVVKNFHDKSYSIQMIADRLGKYPRWVEIRLKIAKAPEWLKKEIAAGIYTQEQVDKILARKSEEQQAEVARTIKEIKEKFGNRIEAKLPDEPGAKPKIKAQKPQDIMKAAEQIVSFGKPGFEDILLTLRWCAGYATTDDFNKRLREIKGQ